MVDRIIVKPDRVRGGGNIISPAKIVDDFSCFESSLVVSGGVFGLSYLPGQEIVVTLSASPVSVTVGGSVTFSAVVTGDGDPLEDVTVSFKEEGTVIGTGETDSTGTATLVKSDFSVGVHSVVAGYSTGVSSAVSVTVTDAPVPASVSLTGTKSILSYADSEQSVLTATVLDSNDDPVENASVELYKAGVLWDTLSTDAAGQVSKTYVSAGVGDVSFTAGVGSLVSEIYEVEDCWRYYSSTMTSSQTVNWDLPTDYTIDFEAYNSRTGTGQAWFPIIGTDNNHRVVLGSIQDATKYQMWVNDNSSTIVKTNSTISLPTGWHEEQIKVENGTVTYHDLSVTPSNIDLTNLLQWTIYQTSAQFRNIKIKPL